MSRRAAFLAMVFALVGLGASLEAVYVHYRLLSDPSYVSFCDVNVTVSCSEVYRSRYSTLFGIPVAIFGALAFVVALLLTLAGRIARSSVRENVPVYLFVLSTVSLGVVLFMGYTSFVVLKAVCLLCLTTYASVIGLFVISAAATSVPMATLPARLVNDARVFVRSPLAITMTVLLLAATASAAFFFPREGAAAQSAVPSEDRRAEFERWYTAQPRVPLAIPKEGARVLVVEFSDYMCSACSMAYSTGQSVFAKYQAEQPGAVRLVMKDFPLDAECNSHVVDRGPHPAACEAAVAVRLAQRGRAAAMEEWLFANQASLTPPSVRQAARDVGLAADYDAKYASTLELIREDVALGARLGVRSTPTFFINGVKIEGTLPSQYFDQAIAYELQHAPSK